MTQYTPYSANSGTAVSPRRRHSFVADIYLGAVRGDFADDLRIPGRITQAALAYVPILGNIMAFRDFIADRRKRDHVGAFLNALALIPFLGGFPKTAATIRTVRHIGLTAHHAISHSKNRTSDTPTA
ncbi:MAG TPA: hypothetical protein VKB76_07245 [Ktedonobacterales bacterium]|nr:hypothetical protein [Ktedonobacterales bacterium]